MTVRSATLVADVCAGGTVDRTLATVPSGSTWILKSWHVQTADPGSPSSALYILRPSNGAAYTLKTYDHFGAGGVSGEQNWVVLEPGDEIHGVMASSYDMLVWISGSELAGVAP